MRNFIVTCNAGSSNIKVAKYEAPTLQLTEKQRFSQIAELLAWYKEQQNIVAISHRIVHGGKDFSKPVIINDTIKQKLWQLVELAPLHQQKALDIINAITEISPSLIQTACFDTAFHHNIPELEKLLPLPYAYYLEGIHRYGFHGLSYEYIASALPSTHTAGKVLVAHLGNGSSICGMVSQQSQAISMGFAALDGLMMGSRSGSIEPSVVLHLLRQKNFTASQLEDFLYHQCGLYGLSGISHDVKILEDNGSATAQKALKLYAYIAAKNIGAIATAINGFDCLIFTGGIGENSAFIRQEICCYLTWLGMMLDEQANSTNSTLISAIKSNIPVYVIPTNEELILAKHCFDIIKEHAVYIAFS